MNALRIIKKASLFSSLALLAAFSVQNAQAAIGVDRTRVILDGGNKSVSVSVTNQNKELPYLAQTWIEDVDGNKITSPLMALPPVQRIEPGVKSQIKIQGTGGINLLAQDKESVFYFNVREIPPRSDKPNTLQIALQTRIKLFYRPASLKVDPNAKPWQESLTLSRQGGKYIANNPTPYFVTISTVAATEKGPILKAFKPMMISPNSSAPLEINAGDLGSSPVLTYLNDYGGRPRLIFSCTGDTCHVSKSLMG